MTISLGETLRDQKRILFLHPNFPAQFKHLAKAAADSGHDVRFLCQTHYGRTLPGVSRLTLKGRCSHQHLIALGGDLVQRTTALAKQFREGFINLRSSGWLPDIVISHSGWGCGLFVREVWPNCRHIAYLEWWFDPQSDFLNYDPKNDDLRIDRNKGSKLWLRNQALALELVNANEIVAPTNWQSQQLPPILKARCHIIHDGIDLKQFKPSTKKPKKSNQVVTYGTRGMEPMRAFPQFIKSIILLLKENKDIKIEIAGEDEICYGGLPPKSHKTWGEWAKQELSKTHLSQRVKWMGYLKSEQYVTWLQASDCHVHLTHPFVASWSLLEALACQCPMVVSDVAPVRELCEATMSEVTYVDHRDSRALPMAIAKTLRRQQAPRTNFQNLSIKTFSREASIEQWTHVAGLKLTTNH